MFTYHDLLMVLLSPTYVAAYNWYFKSDQNIVLENLIVWLTCSLSLAYTRLIASEKINVTIFVFSNIVETKIFD